MQMCSIVQSETNPMTKQSLNNRLFFKSAQNIIIQYKY